MLCTPRFIWQYAYCILIILGSCQLCYSQNTYNSRFVLASLDTSTSEVCYDLQLANAGDTSWRLFGFNINIFYDASISEFLDFEVVSDFHVSESAPITRVLPIGTISNTGLLYDSIGFIRVNVSEKIQGEGERFDTRGEWISIMQLCFLLSFDDVTDPNTCFTLNFDTPEIIDARIVLPDLVQESDPDLIAVDLVSVERQDLLPDKTLNTCFILDEDTPDLCQDGIDNDQDGLLDCMDPSCGPGEVVVMQSAIECFNPLGTIQISEGNEQLSYSIDGGMTFVDSGRFEDLVPAQYDVVVLNNGVSACSFTTSVIFSSPMCDEADDTSCRDGMDNDGDGDVDCDDINCLPRIEDVLITRPTRCPSLDNGMIEIITDFPDVEYSIDNGDTYSADPIFSDLSQDTFDILIRNMNTLCEQSYWQNPVIIAVDTICLPSIEDCQDGMDNDLDGLIDCSDDDCLGMSSCANLPLIYIPNILSVGSTANGVLTIQSEEQVDLMTFAIYDRWGNNIYIENQSLDNILWDGSTNGVTRTGVFIYHLQIEVAGSIFNLTGDISVVR